MSLDVQKIKPCLLVLPKAQVKGWVKYTRGDVEVKPYLEGGEHSQWPVEKTVSDKDEFKAARAMARRAKKAIERLGIKTEIGVFVPYDLRDQVRAIEEAASEEMAKFSEDAEFGFVRLRIGVFEVQGENQTMLDVAMDQVRENLALLKESIKKADYQGIRKTIKKMKGFEEILPEEQSNKIGTAIEMAKEQAKQIRADLEKFSIPLEKVQEQMNTVTVDIARFAMIDPEDEPDEDMKQANDFAEAMYARTVDIE